jgi:small subunit ribosomal protein S6e
MKLNIAYPEYRSQQIIEIDDDKKLRIFYDKRISEEVAADPLGEEFKGYVLKITGGHDKQGFGMKQGVLLNHRTRLLLDGTTGQYRPKRDGARKRKSIRGCIVGNDLSCINLVIVKRGPQDIPKLTDKASDRPSTRGPKRANHIRQVWGLSKTEDVRKYVVRRKIPGKNGKPDRFKSPKIQRLITPVVRYRKKQRLADKRKRYEKATAEAAEYQKLLTQKRQQARAALLSKKRDPTKSEKKSVKAVSVPATTATKAAPATKGAAKAPVKAAPAKAEPAKAAPTKPAATTTAKGGKTQTKTGKK